MGFRKCSKEEAQQAAIIYGVNSVHLFKEHFLNNYLPISQSDVYIDTQSGEVYIGDKDGSNMQPTHVKLR